MRRLRLTAWLALHPLRLWQRKELIFAPLEPILHPSPQRLWWLGLFIFSGHALYGWIWSYWLPQPYENLTLRVMASLLGGSLMTRRVNHDPGSRLTQWIFGLVFWLDLPVLFSWMYLGNSGSAVWLASTTVMVVIYYQVTDWRLATVGTLTGGLLAWGLFHDWGPDVPAVPENQLAIDTAVLAFAWTCALVLSLLSANRRREHLASTLATIGIMAHEMRTPLSTVALIGDAIQLEVQRQPDTSRAPQLDRLAARLHMLVRNMNHQIDMQIANAKLLQLTRYSERVSAAQLVHDVVAAYPYPSTRQRECVKVLVHNDFTFLASTTQFSQVLDNLIKNALHSLVAADSRYPHGALCINVGLQRQRGRIVVTDDGMGIDAALLPQIFNPFFSSNHGTGHGLGLAFCRQVVKISGGRIHVKSEYAVGAIFTIELPIAS